MRTKIARTQSLTTEVTDWLREQIAHGRFTVGARLPTEMEICAETGASRTVIREAIATLKAEGLVETRHGLGSFILATAPQPSFQLSRDELLEINDALHILELRMAIEIEMAGAAAVRGTAAEKDEIVARLEDLVAADVGNLSREDADFALHRAIAVASNNPYFVRFMDFLGARAIPPRAIAAGEVEAASMRSYSTQLEMEHRRLVETIVSGDRAKARAAARRHLVNSMRRHRTRQDDLTR